MALAPTLQQPLDLRLSPEQFALVCATIPLALLEPAAATPVRQGPWLFDLRIKGSLDAECIGSCIRLRRRT
jgi:hypothetical protein